MVINRHSHGVLIGTAGIFSKGANFKGLAIIKIKENFGPDVESMESKDSVFIGVVRSSNAVASDIFLARRDVGNHITVVSHSLDFTDVVHNSVGKVKVSDSGTAISVEMDTILVNDVAQGSVESSESSKSTAETVTNEVEIVVRVSIGGLLNSVHEVVSHSIFIVVVEISTGNSIFKGVKIVSDGSGAGDFIE
jgi:hypothetical protein